MKKRVGILTSGGDCPGLNATIRGVAKALYARMGEDVEIVGILNGYSGLINGDYKEMCEDDFRGILTLGGTMDETGTQITGGITIQSDKKYTLNANDATSPITEANHGTASIKAVSKGDTFTVTYPGDEVISVGVDGAADVGAVRLISEGGLFKQQLVAGGGERVYAGRG